VLFVAWALTKHWKNDSIFKMSNEKYHLLKRVVETKEPVNKKTINNFRDGDLVTIIFRHSYKTWVKEQLTGIFVEVRKEDVEEVTFTLREYKLLNA
jgi:hypothetical protein